MILVLTGPTGSGKTSLAISLAKKLNAVIINGDAFQVYRELNIATAKPSEEQRMQVPHYLFDFIPLDEDYNVAGYQKDLRAELAELEKSKTNVIIAGGTGLYIRAGLYDYEFLEQEEIDLSAYEKMDNASLHHALEEMDPRSASAIHPNNRVRLLNAIRIYKTSGKKKSELLDEQEHKPLYPCLFYGVEKERQDLYRLVEERVDEMFDAGLLEETEALVKRYGRTPHAFKAIGVKELFPYFDGEITLGEAKAQIKKNTRHYIKRQMTFFRNQFDITWISNEQELLKDLEEKGILGAIR